MFYIAQKDGDNFRVEDTSGDQGLLLTREEVLEAHEHCGGIFGVVMLPNHTYQLYTAEANIVMILQEHGIACVRNKGKVCFLGDVLGFVDITVKKDKMFGGMRDVTFVPTANAINIHRLIALCRQEENGTKTYLPRITS